LLGSKKVTPPSKITAENQNPTSSTEYVALPDRPDALGHHCETLDTEGLCILGNLLPKIIFLNLTTCEMIESTSIIRKNGFPCLTASGYNCKQNVGMGLQFEARAMPQL
jgi:hypothetical protein